MFVLYYSERQVLVLLIAFVSISVVLMANASISVVLMAIASISVDLMSMFLMVIASVTVALTNPLPQTSSRICSGTLPNGNKIILKVEREKKENSSYRESYCSVLRNV